MEIGVLGTHCANGCPAASNASTVSATSGTWPGAQRIGTIREYWPLPPARFALAKRAKLPAGTRRLSPECVQHGTRESLHSEPQNSDRFTIAQTVLTRSPYASANRPSSTRSVSAVAQVEELARPAGFMMISRT